MTPTLDLAIARAVDAAAGVEEDASVVFRGVVCGLTTIPGGRLALTLDVLGLLAQAPAAPAETEPENEEHARLREEIVALVGDRVGRQHAVDLADVVHGRLAARALLAREGLLA